MKTIRKLMELTKEEYFQNHLLIINPLLPKQVTSTEAKVLGAFMALEGDLKKDPFSTTGRKLVMEKLGGMSPGGLGNHLRELKSKQFIYEDKNGELKIPAFLIPGPTEQLYEFKLKLKENV